MKVCIIGDVHYSQYSSILRKRGEKYSKRLENLINSLNWAEEQAELNNCDRIIYLGDTFDRSDLNAEELTALQEVVWSEIPHSMLVGNHEGLMNDLSISSAHLFKLIPNVEVIDQPKLEVGFGYRFLFLPYILEEDRLTIKDYFRNESNGVFETQEVKHNYIFSHNDIKMNYGLFESKEGFDISDIEKSGGLFFNGHLHNGSKFCKNGWNVGNLTGQNFGEDASKYKHQICILDTDTRTEEWIENPFAFNFYKFEINDISLIDSYISKLKNNSVVTIKAPEAYVKDIRTIIEECDKIKEFRVVSIPNKDVLQGLTEQIEIETVNHLDQFVSYVRSNLPVTDLLLSELSEVCK
jgi:DNA repair exonuclease SbcCD nuclease subunit